MVMGLGLICCFRGSFPGDEAQNDSKPPAVSPSCLNTGRQAHTASARPAAASLAEPWNLYFGNTPPSAISETEHPVAVLALERGAHIQEPDDVVFAASLECVYINDALRKGLGAPSPQAYRRLVFEELLNVEMNLLIDIRDTLLSLSSPVCHTPLLTVASIATNIKGSFESTQPQSHPVGQNRNTGGFPVNDRQEINEADYPYPDKQLSPQSPGACRHRPPKNSRRQPHHTVNNNANTDNNSSYPCPSCNHSPCCRPSISDLGLEGLRLHPCWIHEANESLATTMQSLGVATLDTSATATTTATANSNGRRPGVMLWHRQPLSWHHSRAVALRSLGLLSNLDSAITLISCSGRVVYQNASSRRYYGRLLGLGPDTGAPGGLASPGVDALGIAGAMLEEEVASSEDGNHGVLPLRRALTDTDTDGGVAWAGGMESILRGLSETRLLGRLFACELQPLVHDMLAAWAAGRVWKRLLHVPPAAGPYGNWPAGSSQLHNKPPLMMQGQLWQQPPPAQLPAAAMLRPGTGRATAGPAVSVVDLSVAAEDLSVQVVNTPRHSAHDSCAAIDAEGNVATSSILSGKCQHGNQIVVPESSAQPDTHVSAGLSSKSTISLMPITPPMLQSLSPLPFPPPPTATSRPASPQSFFLPRSSKSLLSGVGRTSPAATPHSSPQRGGLRASRMSSGISPTPSATTTELPTDPATAVNLRRPCGAPPSGTPPPIHPPRQTTSTPDKILSPAMSINMEIWGPGGQPSGSGYTGGDRNGSGSGGAYTSAGTGVLSSAAARLQSGVTLLIRGRRNNNNASPAVTAATESEGVAARAHSMDMAHLRFSRSSRKPAFGCGQANGSSGVLHGGHGVNRLDLGRPTSRAVGHEAGGPYRAAFSARAPKARNNSNSNYDDWSVFAEGLPETSSGPELEDPLQLSAWRAAIKVSLRHSLETAGGSMTRHRAQNALGGGFGHNSTALDMTLVPDADVSRHAGGAHSTSNCLSSTPHPTRSNTLGLQSSTLASGSAHDPLRRALGTTECMAGGDDGFNIRPSSRRVNRRSSMEAAITLAASASRSFSGASHALLPRRTTVGIGTEPCIVRHLCARRQAHSVIGYLRNPSFSANVEMTSTASHGPVSSATTGAASRLMTGDSARRLSVSFIAGTARSRVVTATTGAGAAKDVATEDPQSLRPEFSGPSYRTSSDFDVRRQLLRAMHTALTTPSPASQVPSQPEVRISVDEDENWAEAKGLLPSTRHNRVVSNSRREGTTAAAASETPGRHSGANGGESDNIAAAWRASVTSASTRDAFNINLTLGELMLPGSVGGDITVARRSVGSDMVSAGVIPPRLGGGGGSIKSVSSTSGGKMVNSCSGWNIYSGGGLRSHCTAGCMDPGVARMLDVGGVPYRGPHTGLSSQVSKQLTSAAASGTSPLLLSPLPPPELETPTARQGEISPAGIQVELWERNQICREASVHISQWTQPQPQLPQLQPHTPPPQQQQHLAQSHVYSHSAQQAVLNHTAANVQQQVRGAATDNAGDEGVRGVDKRCLRWHEVTAAPFFDPVTGQRMLLLVQADVTARVEAERRLVELTAAQTAMLEQMFPRHVLEFVVAHGEAMGEMDFSAHVSDFATTHDMATVLFMDIVGFTTMSKEVPAAAVMTFLSDLYGKLDALVDQYGVWKVETAGDCYIVAAGVVAPDADGFHSVITTEHRTVIDLSPMTTLDNARATPSSLLIGNPIQDAAAAAAGPVSAPSAAAARTSPCPASSPLPAGSRYGPNLLAFWASEGARADGGGSTRPSPSTPQQQSLLGVSVGHHLHPPHVPLQLQQQQEQLPHQALPYSPQQSHTQHRSTPERLTAAGGSAGGRSVGSGAVTASGGGPSGGLDARRDAESVFRFALAALAAAREVTTPHDDRPVQLRVGIHSGPLVSGVIGTKMPKFALFGDTMNTASRMESTCKPGCVQVSAATRALLPSALPLTPTGGIEVKGKGVMETFFYDPSPPQQPPPVPAANIITYAYAAPSSPTASTAAPATPAATTAAPPPASKSGLPNLATALH